MKFTLDWFKAAGIRMLRTAAQVALGMLTVGMTISEVDWLNVLSVSVVAAVYSLLTSIVTGLPEAGSDGTVSVLPTGEIDNINIDLTKDDIIKKGLVKLMVSETDPTETKVYEAKH